jgi:phospholipase C
MRSFWNLVVLGVTVVLGAGCLTSSSTAALICDAGSSLACTCADGTQSVATCRSNGGGFGACACGSPDGGPDAGVDGGWHTNIEHVVVIVEENHTFDSYFGSYCTAPAYSNPTCTKGAKCCEAAPATDPNGFAPIPLTDVANYDSDHDHGVLCEVCQIDDGGMDHYTDGGCPNSVGGFAGFVTYDCSAPENFMIASDPNEMATYWGYANRYALADHYFQPIAGGTSSNDMYFAVSHYEFSDNDVMPNAVANGCTTNSSPQPGVSFPGRTTIADLLIAGGFSFGVYADGYADAYMAYPGCPSPGGTCREQFLTSACVYDPSDVPFQYYPQFTDDLAYMHDLTSLFTDVSAGTLPDFAYVKYRTTGNEHPEWSYVTDGEQNVDAVVQAILGSPKYQSNTLILLTWDEGGGFFDHVSPPPSIENYPADAGARAGQPIPYGTRVPMLALGAFAQQGAISHVQLEHSSVVRFLEWNFLGPDAQGAIHATDPSARDNAVNNLGSLLDSAAVGTPVP